MSQPKDTVQKEIAPGVKVEWSKSLGGPLREVKPFKPEPVEEGAQSDGRDLSPVAVLAAREANPETIKHEDVSALAVATAAAHKDKLAEDRAKREVAATHENKPAK